MPKIPLRTAQTTPDSPRRSSPKPNALAYGAPEARGQAVLGGSLRDVRSTLVNAQSLVTRMSVRKTKAEEADERIEQAKLDQDLGERIVDARLRLKQAKFEAMSSVISDAEIEPGSEPDQASNRPTLYSEFERLADEKLDGLRNGMDPERQERFDRSVRILQEEGELSIAMEQRRRDIDSSRSSLERTERKYKTLAEDATEDIDGVIAGYNANVDLSVERGAYSFSEGLEMKEAAADEFREAHEKATFKRDVQAVADDIISNEFMTSTEKVAAARSFPDPDFRDSVTARVKARIREGKEFARDELSEQLEVIEDGFKSGEMTLDEVDMDLYSDPEIRNGIRTLWSRVVKDKQKDEKAKQKIDGDRTAAQTSQALWHMAEADPSTFEDIELFHFRPLMKGPDYRRLKNAQKALRKDSSAPIESPYKKTGAYNVKTIAKKMYPESREMQAWAIERVKDLGEIEVERLGRPMNAMEAKKMLLDVTRTSRPSHDSSALWHTMFPGTTPIIEIEPEKAREITERDAADQDPQWIKMAENSLADQEVYNPTNEQLEQELIAIFDRFGLYDEPELIRPDLP